MLMLNTLRLSFKPVNNLSLMILTVLNNKSAIIHDVILNYYFFGREITINNRVALQQCEQRYAGISQCLSVSYSLLYKQFILQ